jgi:two-component system, NtrC family, response regulator AtoC
MAWHYASNEPDVATPKICELDKSLQFRGQSAPIRLDQSSTMEEKQAWITCYLTDMLLSYVRDHLQQEERIDYPALYRAIEGFDVPANPKSFLADTRNWIPLSVLRELELQCELISGRKDIAYYAARDYFAPGRRELPSLFEIIVQVLNDVRSAFIFANLWGASQTNYLKLQSFEKQVSNGGLCMLSQFDEHARPTIGAINLLKGFSEGFPRLYPFIQEVQCIEEITQLSLQDVLREFPQYDAITREDCMDIRHRSSEEISAQAKRVVLRSETVSLSKEVLQLAPEAAVVEPQNGQIQVLTNETIAGSRSRESTGSLVYQITRGGVLSHGPLSYALREGQIFGTPYSRFRFVVKATFTDHKEVSPETLRQEVSQLLFEHLKQAKEAHTRIAQISDEKRWLTAENIRLRREVEREYSFAGLIGQSRAMQELFSLVRSLAEIDVTVLIEGETGTGKELIARAIHYNGLRKNKRFVAINCGALSPTLLESELFGHEKGAFTGAMMQKKGIFEVADGGTLFLDEVGEIPASTQVKLLRVLQEGEVQRVGGTDTIKVNVRIIAATNKNLEALTQNGEFRQDLFYRLNVFPVVVPPLRVRIDDIPLLIAHFIEKFNPITKKTVKEISSQALASLMAHSWPGNIRELENAIQRMMIVCKTDRLEVQDVPPQIRGTEAPRSSEAKDLKGISRGSVELVEKRSIMDALSKTGGNVTQAAKILGVSRATLQNKMKLYGLRRPKT